jgi:hypothetical protein
VHLGPVSSSYFPHLLLSAHFCYSAHACQLVAILICPCKWARRRRFELSLAHACGVALQASRFWERGGSSSDDDDEEAEETSSEELDKESGSDSDDSSSSSSSEDSGKGPSK